MGALVIMLLTGTFTLVVAAIPLYRRAAATPPQRRADAARSLAASAPARS